MSVASGPSRWPLRAALTLVALVGLLVPRRRRAAWRAEWRGELHHFWNRRPGALDVVRRGLLTLPHALALVRQEWNPDMLTQDLRLAVRRLLASPGFSLVALATLAVGVGAVTAIFSVVHSTILEPLPYPDADRIVQLWKEKPGGGSLLLTPSSDDIERWRERATSFEEIVAASGASLTLTGAGEPQELRGLRVTPRLLDFIGVAPARGRSFQPGEATSSARVVVVSDGFWRSRFGADPEILERSITLDGEPHRVVGVLPRGFVFQGPFSDTQVWLPLPEDGDEEVRSALAVARLRPGVTAEAANEELAAIAAAVAEDAGEGDSATWPGKVRRAQDMVGTDFRTSVLALQGAVALVLLIACVNVANLLLARGTARQRDVAVRAALGASRTRLLRELLTENLLLALLGGAAGLALARGGVALIVEWRPERLTLLDGVRVDGPVLAFSLAVALGTSVLFGLVPALRASRSDIVGPINQGQPSTRGSRRDTWTRNALVAVEVALSVVLLVGAGLLLGSLRNLMSTDLGFTTENVLTLSVSLPEERYPEAAQRGAFRQDLTERLETSLGDRVESLALAVGTPPNPGVAFGTFAVDGEEPQPEFDNVVVPSNWVAPGFFSTLGIDLIDGRDFVEGDADSDLEPVIVNATWARRMFGTEEAAGRRIVSGRGESRDVSTVVGVVADARLDGPMGGLSDLRLYSPLGGSSSLSILLRAGEDPLALAGIVKEQIWALDPDLPVRNVARLDRLMADTLGNRRFIVTLMGVFAAVALGLALVGVYGVLSYATGRRTREIGLRKALGARPGDLVGMVVWQGLRPVLAGAALGVVSSLALARVIGSLLHGVEVHDPATHGAVVLLLVAVATLACLLPARRAVRLDAVEALRLD